MSSLADVKRRLELKREAINFAFLNKLADHKIKQLEREVRELELQICELENELSVYNQMEAL